jgi:1,2-phenylacetyl-CoA epoxidase catalytic subunit
MLPRPVDPGSLVFPGDPVTRLAFGAAWRERALGHALGHGCRRVPGGAIQAAVLGRMAHSLAASDAFLAACEELGCRDAELLVQARLLQEPLPYVESLAEACIAELLFAGALDAGLAALAGTSHVAVAKAIRSAGSPPAPFGGEVLDALAREQVNRPCLQLLVDRWMPPAIRAFGRPGSAAETSLLDARVKLVPTATVVAGFLGRCEERLQGLGLVVRDGPRMGVELPGAWTPGRRRTAAGSPRDP